ncbi:ferritin heavy chain-like [Phyllostomus discolor]|uniref:Ferritin n=1 Tax=Phyllostomus discolor TaxID=89673 RepID=A0A7E6CMS8_9CHIR|nr:ferritin heavy chain-like [Phyllostomus discolor]
MLRPSQCLSQISTSPLKTAPDSLLQESLGFPASTVLGWNLVLTPSHPSLLPRSILLPPLTTLLDHPKFPATTPVPRSCLSSAAITTTSVSQVRQNLPQDSRPPLTTRSTQSSVSYVYLSMSYYFDRNDVALKNFAECFLHQSHEEREHTEKLMKLQDQ